MHETVTNEKKRALVTILRKKGVHKHLRLAGLDRGIIYRWESGQRMRLSHYTALCDILKVDPHRLAMEIENGERFKAISQYRNNLGKSMRTACGIFYMNVLHRLFAEAFPKVPVEMKLPFLKSDEDTIKLVFKFENGHQAEVHGIMELTDIRVVLEHAPPQSHPIFVLESYAGGCDFENILRILKQINDNKVERFSSGMIPSSLLDHRQSS